eukprot:gnl/TRDRNA2_/TRDRNA2_167041_c0_seq3.p1 gnl/TRDRNA2_/TRDRNA2_167041_c0~~gnl/TRDRNA2_/TRDRNA2_167041_c0_seq3.p1  ORF type:complete len:247 (-),score=27.17 gnl/TRDRNA2_/TRDRNA2_167041_c0_seq3:55-795(-)
MQGLGGGIHAYRLSDGKLLWERDLPHQVLTWPVAAKVNDGPEYTVFAFPSAGSSGFQDEALFNTFIYEMVLPVTSACLAASIVLQLRGVQSILPYLGVVVVGFAALAYISWGLLEYRFVQGTPSEIHAFKADTGEKLWSYQLDYMKKKNALGEDEGFAIRSADSPWRSVCAPVAYSSPSVDGNGVVFIGHMSGKFFGVKDWNGDGQISKEEVSVFNAEAAFLHSGPAFAPGMFAFTTCDSLWVWRM